MAKLVIVLENVNALAFALLIPDYVLIRIVLVVLRQCTAKNLYSYSLPNQMDQLS